MIKYNKVETTKLILDELPNSLFKESYKNCDIDKIVFQWWQTGRSGTGLRLTDEGEKAFELASIKKYDFEDTVTKTEFTTKFINRLNKRIPCPFTLRVKNKASDVLLFVTLYDSKVAVLVTLTGNIVRYINRKLYEE
jgi:hypothetical protein